MTNDLIKRYPFLALEDLAGMTENEVKGHLADNYAGEEDGDTRAYRKMLEDYDVLIAYESVGNYGCDSSGWYLLNKKNDGSFYMINGSHCSCFGFEGQGDLDPTDFTYLKSERFRVYLGGYDSTSGYHADRSEVEDKIDLLQQITVERGATPQEQAGAEAKIVKLRASITTNEMTIKNYIRDNL